MNLKIGQLHKILDKVHLYSNQYFVLDSEIQRTIGPNELCMILQIKAFSSYHALHILKSDGTVGWIMYLLE
jgi:hypothetical protein